MRITLPFFKAKLVEECEKHDYHAVWGYSDKSVCYSCGQIICNETGIILIPSKKARELMKQKGLTK